MRKKIIFLVLLAGIMGMSTSSFASKLHGVGVYGNFVGEGSAPGGGLGLSLKFGNFPILGVEWSIRENSVSVIGTSIDWWVWSQAIGSGFYWYAGVGGYFGFIFWESNFDFDFGLRGVIGLQFFPIKPIELFLEFAPILTFLQGDTFQLGIGYNLRLGVRWRF